MSGDKTPCALPRGLMSLIAVTAQFRDAALNDVSDDDDDDVDDEDEEEEAARVWCARACMQHRLNAKQMAALAMPTSMKYSQKGVYDNTPAQMAASRINDGTYENHGDDDAITIEVLQYCSLLCDGSGGVCGCQTCVQDVAGRRPLTHT